MKVGELFDVTTTAMGAYPTTDAALAAVDVGMTESHSPVPRTVPQSGRRTRVVVDIIGSSQDGSIIDLTSTGTVKVPGSDEEE